MNSDRQLCSQDNTVFLSPPEEKQTHNVIHWYVVRKQINRLVVKYDGPIFAVRSIFYCEIGMSND